MTKRVLGIAAAAALTITALGSSAATAGPAPTVDICHFPGHQVGEPPARIIRDFQVFGPPDADRCTLRGGNIISVNANGALNGHGVRVRIPIPR